LLELDVIQLNILYALASDVIVGNVYQMNLIN